ncbi:response regulator [Sphingobacterium sp. HJSM2_6]|uniref:response regulator n=1 Tax=Sphingobacterium sp. HJSM2_6 TaxID=3366264 RepID=UPI003BC4E952
MIKIILVEDHVVVRNGIKLLLDSSGEFEIINEAKDGLELLTILSDSTKPDIVISDINMPKMDGIQLTKELGEKYPNIHVILLSMLNTADQVIDAFSKGAKGYLVKNVGYQELIFAIKHIAKGGKYVSEELSLLMMNHLATCTNTGNNKKIDHLGLDLTERELEVLQLISDGYTNMEISDNLFLSKRTVEGHRQNLINKLKVRNSAELIKFAAQHNLIQ